MAQEGQIAVRLRDVWKVFRSYRTIPRTLKEAFLLFGRWKPVEVNALQGISLDIHFGELVGIVGRNGSGKTTLLATVAGIYQPTKGSVETFGRVVALLGVTGGFHPELTAEENLLFVGTVLGVPLIEMKKRLPAIFEFSELTGYEQAPMRTYSLGMTVRLGFALGIHSDADIFLVDEQLQSTDASFQNKALQALKDLRERGKAVVLVTHELPWVTKIATRAIWLDKGKIMADGKPEDVVKAYLMSSQ
ncbi:MAG: ABC transporter ATP-binding protein [Armatimonadetes bacterium]|nr:ABC transporter ATP-binding protein [Armatimonadota bacterium]MCX7968388.1 ABC transporter ATP-binding protein [Armatimonadota bacterium]MDW8143499.1 ABC transporter ATP-binding protein [Armatimonadota bacterium]